MADTPMSPEGLPNGHNQPLQPNRSSPFSSDALARAQSPPQRHARAQWIAHLATGLTQIKASKQKQRHVNACEPAYCKTMHSGGHTEYTYNHAHAACPCTIIDACGGTHTSMQPPIHVHTPANTRIHTYTHTQQVRTQVHAHLHTHTHTHTMRTANKNRARKAVKENSSAGQP